VLRWAFHSALTYGKLSALAYDKLSALAYDKLSALAYDKLSALAYDKLFMRMTSQAVRVTRLPLSCQPPEYPSGAFLR
ncbi:MAG: hypothetical protein WAV53_21690, partial [Anaerolineae bacterium]